MSDSENKKPESSVTMYVLFDKHSKSYYSGVTLNGEIIKREQDSNAFKMDYQPALHIQDLLNVISRLSSDYNVFWSIESVEI